VTAPTERFVVANGLRHHVLEWAGAGPTFVLAHGFLDVAWSFHELATRLAAHGHRVLAFDWRGHGESDWVGPGGYYHFPDYVADLDALLPELDDGPVGLVGHSMGATACAMFAGLRSDRLRSVALLEGLGPPASPSEATVERFEAWLGGLERARHRAPVPMRDLEDVLTRLRRHHPDAPEAMLRLVAERSTREVQGGRVYRFDPLHRTRAPLPFRVDAFCDFLRRIEVPTLVVHGERGFRLPDEGERLACIHDAQAIEIPGAGHMLHWDAPEALASVLTRH
jgi:pimeloyl-ACP methyl ester carboxylesterase